VIINPFLIYQNTSIPLYDGKCVMTVQGTSIFRDKLIGSGVLEVEQPDLVGTFISLTCDS